MNYEELVKALRCETSNSGDCWEKKCQYLVCGSYAYCNSKRIMSDAAAAIEALQAQLPKRGEIVRCGECKWYEADLCANPWGVCFHEDWVANNIGHTVDEDGFCYRGEREVQE